MEYEDAIKLVRNLIHDCGESHHWVAMRLVEEKLTANNTASDAIAQRSCQNCSNYRSDECDVCHTFSRYVEQQHT